jgi:hypothetical protein
MKTASTFGTRFAWLGLVAVLSISLAACAPQSPDSATGREPDPSAVATAERALSDTPEGWNQLLPYDGIRPIYDPHFAKPDEIDLHDGELVMGVAWEGEAKAYPVSVLRTREMVNDEMAGVPYLVSW